MTALKEKALLYEFWSSGGNILKTLFCLERERKN